MANKQNKKKNYSNDYIFITTGNQFITQITSKLLQSDAQYTANRNFLIAPLFSFRWIMSPSGLLTELISIGKKLKKEEELVKNHALEAVFDGTPSNHQLLYVTVCTKPKDPKNKEAQRKLDKALGKITKKIQKQHDDVRAARAEEELKKTPQKESRSVTNRHLVNISEYCNNFYIRIPSWQEQTRLREGISNISYASAILLIASAGLIPRRQTESSLLQIALVGSMSFALAIEAFNSNSKQECFKASL